MPSNVPTTTKVGIDPQDDSLFNEGRGLVESHGRRVSYPAKERPRAGWGRGQNRPFSPMTSRRLQGLPATPPWLPRQPLPRMRRSVLARRGALREDPKPRGAREAPPDRMRDARP